VNICYLVVAHKEPKLLLRQAQALSCPQSKIFVHVDAKSNISEFDDVYRLPNVVKPKTRIKVAHGGFTQVQVYLSLLREAYAYKKFDYFVFMSGQCYPILSNSKIIDFYKKQVDSSSGTNQSLLGFYELSPGANCYSHYSKYHFRDVEQQFPELRPLFRIASKILPRKPLPRHYNRTGIKIFRGSFFSSLTREAVEFIIDNVHSELGEDVSQHLRYAFGSDEMYFQTMLLNSPLASKCAGYEEYVTNGTFIRADDAHCHLIDWTPEREMPAIMQADDFDRLVASNLLYFRKASLPDSSTLLDRIDAQRVE
jgi:hypothetical protein